MSRSALGESTTIYEESHEYIQYPGDEGPKLNGDRYEWVSTMVYSQTSLFSSSNSIACFTTATSSDLANRTSPFPFTCIRKVPRRLHQSLGMKQWLTCLNPSCAPSTNSTEQIPSRLSRKKTFGPQTPMRCIRSWVTLLKAAEGIRNLWPVPMSLAFRRYIAVVELPL